MKAFDPSYVRLFQKVSDAIQLLQEAQLEAEELYMQGKAPLPAEEDAPAE